MPIEVTIVAPQNRPEVTFVARHDACDARIDLKRHSTLERLVAWLADPSADPSNKFQPTLRPWYARDLWFDNADGHLHMYDGGKVKRFDPHSEESMASLVRALKRLAPMPKGEPLLPLELPKPTPEQLANAQVFKAAAAAGGVKAPKKPRPRSKPKLDDDQMHALMQAVISMPRRSFQ